MASKTEMCLIERRKRVWRIHSRQRRANDKISADRRKVLDHSFEPPVVSTSQVRGPCRRTSSAIVSLADLAHKSLYGAPPPIKSNALAPRSSKQSRTHQPQHRGTRIIRRVLGVKSFLQVVQATACQIPLIPASIVPLIFRIHTLTRPSTKPCLTAHRRNIAKRASLNAPGSPFDSQRFWWRSTRESNARSRSESDRTRENSQSYFLNNLRA